MTSAAASDLQRLVEERGGFGKPPLRDGQPSWLTSSPTTRRVRVKDCCPELMQLPVQEQDVDHLACRT
jgi:hypothetical protein